MMKTLGNIQYMAVVLCLVATLWGCSEENVMPEPEGKGTPIAFATDDGWNVQSRATGSTTNHFPDGTQMGLFAFYIPKDGSLDATQVPNFMNNQEVKASTKITEGGETQYITSWSYSPVKYWPQTRDEHLSFFGYYPWVSTATATVNKVEYTLDGTQNVMWINKVNGKDVNSTYTTSFAECTNGSVGLNFEHKLMRLRFEFLAVLKSFESLTPEVKSLIVKSNTASSAKLRSSLTLNLITGGTDYVGTVTDGFHLLRDAEGNQKDSFDIYDESVSKDDNIIAGEMYIDPEADNEELPEAEQVKSLSLEIKLVDGTEELNYVVDVALKSPAAGKSYLLELTFDKDNGCKLTLAPEPWTQITYDDNPPIGG